MTLHNVTPTHYSHRCNSCGHEHNNTHAGARYAARQTDQGVQHALAIDCPVCRAAECFNCDLPVEHEFHPALTEEHREQARQIRQLMKHRGIPLHEERG
jgi:hypothetical protein